MLRRKWKWLAGAVFFLVLGGYGVGWSIYDVVQAGTGDTDWTYRKLAQEIRRHTDKPVIFFRAEAHALAFYVGRPLDTLLEWKNLEVWANQAVPIYIVMPPECAAAKHGSCRCRSSRSPSSSPTGRRPG